MSAGGKKRKEEKYAKVFKDAKVEKAVDGFLGLYKKDGKLYLEIPKSELGSELLLWCRPIECLRRHHPHTRHEERGAALDEL